MSDVVAMIFAKYPQPGRVSTRLTPPLSPVEAAAVHELSCRAVLERVKSIPQIEPYLWVTPDDRVEAMAERLGIEKARCRAQGEGDLGARLARAAQWTFKEKKTGVILLGADSPTLPVDVLHDALEGLRRNQASLSPSADGGYCLLALPRFTPELFERIDWGGCEVAEQTRQRARESGVVLHELAGWYDLDRFDDLSRAAADLAAQDAGPSTPAADALRRRIEELLAEYATWKS